MKQLVLNMVCREKSCDLKTDSAGTLVKGFSRDILPLFLREVGKYYWNTPKKKHYDYTENGDDMLGWHWVLEKENNFLYDSGFLITSQAVFSLKEKKIVHKFWRDTYPIVEHGDMKAIICTDGTVRVEHGKGTVHLNNNGRHARCASFSPKNEYLAVGYDGIIKIWDTETGECLRTISESGLFRHHIVPECVTSIYFLSNSVMASQCKEVVHLWHF